MKNNTFYKLTKEFRAIHDDKSVSTWDAGEIVLFRKAEPKRHAEGTYPDRLISCTDGSMIALSVIRKLEQNMAVKYLEEVK